MPWTVDDLDPTEYYREKTDEWLEYYVHVIMTKAQNANAIVLFSAHKEVQLAVLKAKGKFMRVRPRPDALDTYLGREVSPHCSQFCVRCVLACLDPDTETVLVHRRQETKKTAFFINS